jgi:hypothetical protein
MYGFGRTHRSGDTGHGVNRALRLAVVGGLVAATTVLGLVGASAATGPTLRTVGPANEGPYPWKYPASGKVSVGTGTTVNGVKCAPGVLQLNTPYAPPCVAKFTGSNGGATYNGVTATTITLAQREFPNSANAEELAAEAKAAGDAPPAVTSQVEQVFLSYFNKAYDLYGRKVVIEPMQATGNSTTEALGQGQAQACADADTIANQMHAFGEDGIPTDLQGGGSAPFSQCAAQDKLMEFFGNAYYSETTFQAENPYVWSFTPDCQRIAANMADVIGTELAGKKAIYAGDPSLQTAVRKFGTFIPNVPSYINCNGSPSSLEVKLLTTKYHVPLSAVDQFFHYNLDISTFQQSAQQAIIQFKAAGVTTIVLANDPFSLGDLTQAAVQQDYHPEWLLQGSAATDTDNEGQTYNQSEVDNHMFGVSEASATDTIYGPDSPAGKLYKQLTGRQIPSETDGNYPYLVEIFDALQAAGPDLTPQNVARGLHALPTLGAPNYSYGSWSWNTGPSGNAGGGDHTAVNDARLVYWAGDQISPVNGKMGTFIAIDNGKRFELGQYPKTLPKLFTQ